MAFTHVSILSDHKTKFKKSDDKTNIVKYRVAANITEYQIISNLIFRRIIIPKFIMIRQLFLVKNVYNIGKNQLVLNDLLDTNGRVDMFIFHIFTYIFYLK